MDKILERKRTIHPTHDTQEHPVRGLFCRKCKKWSGDASVDLGEECQGVLDFAKES